MTDQHRADPAVNRSLGLNALVQQLQPECKYKILDLGPAIGTNLEFWSQFPCKIHLEDFSRSLPVETSGEDDEEACNRLFEDLFPYDSNTSFDIILCWDIFNYLNHIQIHSLVRSITRFCIPGTLLFALVSSAHDIPEIPMKFKIIDQEKILYEVQTEKMRPCPRYQPRDVNKMMRGFQVSSSFLLRNGIHEYLFVYRGEA